MLVQHVLVTGFKQRLQINDFITWGHATLYTSYPLYNHVMCTHFWQLLHCIESLPTSLPSWSILHSLLMFSTYHNLGFIGDKLKRRYAPFRLECAMPIALRAPSCCIHIALRAPSWILPAPILLAPTDMLYVKTVGTCHSGTRHSVRNLALLVFYGKFVYVRKLE